jgi:RNA polymerase sigma factor (sigma-70 family)
VTRARRERLIVEHMPLVRKIARQVAGKFAAHLRLEDFEQDGFVGLCEAAKRCDKVSSFAAFAYFRIRGSIIDAHRRKAYREELNPSLEGIEERLEFLPASISTDRGPLPDELAARREMEGFTAAAIAELPEDERFVISQALGGVKVADIAAARQRSATWARAKLAAARGKVAAAVVLGKAA